MPKNSELAEIREKLDGKTIMWVPYMHGDWAWCHTRQWHEIRYVSVIEDVLDLIEKGTGFKWYLDSFKTVLECVVNRKPQLLERIKKCVDAGDIGICGTYSNIRTNMVADEAYIRNMIIGREMFEKHLPGADIQVHADAVDVAIGHQQIPQLVTLGGYRYYRAGRPYAMLFEESGLSHEFLWEGLDGTRVPVWWGDYGGMCLEESARRASADPARWDETVEYIYREELSGICERSNLDLVMAANGCDDALPLKVFNADIDIDLLGVMVRWNQVETSSMRFGTPIDFFREMDKHMDKVRLHKGPADICDVSYNMAWGAERGLTALRMAGAEMLASAERWMALAQMMGICEARELTELWKDNLAASAHATTALFEKDFEEMLALASGALKTAEGRVKDTCLSIARNISLPKNAIAVVFNPDDQPRDAVAELTIPTGFINDLELRDGLGNEVPWQACEPYGYGSIWEYRGLAQVRLPAAGYNVIYAREAVDCRYGAPCSPEKKIETVSSSKPFEMDNGLLGLSFKNGCLTEVYDMEARKAVCPQSETPWNTLRFTKIDTDAYGLQTGPVEYRQEVHFHSYRILEEGPLRWRAELSGRDIRCEYTQLISLEKGSREISYEIRMDWPDGQKGFLSGAIPTEGNDLLYGGIPFGIERKDVAGAHYGKDMHRTLEGLFYAKDFAAAKGLEHTAALYGIRGDRFYIYDKNTKELSYALLNAAAWAEGWEKHVNRFSVNQKGEHVLRYAVGIYPPEKSMCSIARAGRNLRLPPVVCPPYANIGGYAPLSCCDALIRCDRDNLAISALHAQNGGYVLRVWEGAGIGTQAVIGLPVPVKNAQAQDFIGNALAKAPVFVSGGNLELSLKPWEIATIFIET